jgi:serine/threonine-protein kinase
MKRLESVSCAKTLEILNKVNFFDNLSDQEKEILTGFHSHFFLAPRGEVIIQEGAQDDTFYVLLSGKVGVKKKTANRPLVNLHPGDCFGEVSFLTERRRTTTVTSIADSIVFEVDQPTLTHFDQGIREKIKDNLIRVLVSRLDHMNDVVAKLSHRIA